MEVDLRSISPIINLEVRDPNVEYNEDVLRMFKEKLEPTEEDIKRLLSDTELKELCIKVKCRVDAYRWNPVHDYKRFLERRGRFVGKSPEDQRGLVTKAVNRHISTIKYDEEKIKKTRRTEWVMRKKDNILSLDLWKYEREKQNVSEQSSVAMDSEWHVASECDVETEQHHPVNLTEPEIIKMGEEQSASGAINQSSECNDLFLSDIAVGGDETEISDNIDSEINNIDTDQIVAEMNKVDEANKIDDNLKEVGYNSSDEFNEYDNDQTDAIYNSAEIVKRGADMVICALLEVNTESMTLVDSQESLVPHTSQEQQSDQQSENIFHNNYEEFDIDVPLTSTQSQKL